MDQFGLFFYLKFIHWFSGLNISLKIGEAIELHFNKKTLCIRILYRNRGRESIINELVSEESSGAFQTARNGRGNHQQQGKQII